MPCLTPGAEQQPHLHTGAPAGVEHKKLPQQPARDLMDSLPQKLCSCESTSGQPSTSLSSTNQLEQDAALYLEMRTALSDFELQQQQLLKSNSIATPVAPSSRRTARMPPRQTAFYAALRSALQQVVAEVSSAGQHARLVAAHAWFVSHRPRFAPDDPMLAAALAASLSLSTPAQQQQQQHLSVAGHTGRQPLSMQQYVGPGDADASVVSRLNTRQDDSLLCHVEDDSSLCHVEDDSSPCPVPGTLPCSSASVACHRVNSAGLVRSELHSAQAVGHLPSSAAGSHATVLAVKLEAGARRAFQASWGSQAGSSSIRGAGEILVLGGHQVPQAPAAGTRGCSAARAQGSVGGGCVVQCLRGDVAAELPGLIPVGCLPSSRVYGSAGEDSGGVDVREVVVFREEKRGTSAGKPQSSWGGGREGLKVMPTAQQQQQQQQWRQFQDRQAAWACVVHQQVALEADVASSMRSFARQQARIEEEISKRQEMAAVAAAAGACDAADQPMGGRSLRHVDSQHQPSRIAVELTAMAGVTRGASSAAATAAGLACQGSTSNGSAAVQLVVPDKVKAARKQHQQHEQQECKLLQEKLGISDQLLAHALLPPPDVPYMSAFAQLPTYQHSPTVKTTAAKKLQGGKKDR